MANKAIGTQFERDFCEKLARNGWWVHFIVPNARGAQPFDVIAIRGSVVLAADCKTCATDRFPFSRIEDNQRLAFDSLIWKTDARCGFAIKHDDKVYWLRYTNIRLLENLGEKSVRIKELPEFNFYESNR